MKADHDQILFFISTENVDLALQLIKELEGELMDLKNYEQQSMVAVSIPESNVKTFEERLKNIQGEIYKGFDMFQTC